MSNDLRWLMSLAEVLESTRVYDRLSTKHQQMVTRLLELLNELATYERPEDRLDRESWEQFVQRFEASCQAVGTSPQALEELQGLVEEGYRRLLFATNPVIRSQEKKQSRVWVYGKDQIQEVLDQLDEE